MRLFAQTILRSVSLGRFGEKDIRTDTLKEIIFFREMIFFSEDKCSDFDTKDIFSSGKKYLKFF